MKFIYELYVFSYKCVLFIFGDVPIEKFPL